MRNLKKVLSLALALVMLLGMMVVGAGAATSFEDDDKIQNKEAVAVLVGLGVMKGREDNSGITFQPEATLTRAEAAKMIAQLDLGVEAADALKANGNNTFSDVRSDYWAAGPIDYCVEQGYIAGDGNGHFFPNQNVTGVQFASMLLRLLGYDAKVEKLVGDQWAVNAASLARKAGLTTKVLANNQDMTRDGMAQMSFNALTAPMVEYKGMNITVGDATFNSPATIRLHESTQGGLGNKTYDEKTPTPTTPIRLCEERFPYLKLSTTAEDGFGHTAAVWKYRGAEIKGSDTTVAADIVITGKVLKTLPDWAKIEGLGKAAKAKLYVNGDDSNSVTSLPTNDTGIMNLTKNGRLVEIYLNEEDMTKFDKIVVIDTALAEVTKENSDDTISVKLAKSDVTTGSVTLSTKEGVGSVKKGDLVLVRGYNAHGDGEKLGKDTTIAKVEAATELKGFATVKGYDKNQDATYITIDGEKYVDAYGVMDGFTSNEFDLNNEGFDGTLYLDQYGYIMKAIEGKDPNLVNDNLVAVKESYRTLVDGKIVTMVKGVISNGQTVTWQVENDVNSIPANNIYTWDEPNGKRTLYPITTDIPYNNQEKDENNAHVATVKAGAISFKASDVFGKDKAQTVMYSSNVKFIFVGSSGISVLTGRQTYNLEAGKTVAQAFKDGEITAVFIGTDPDVVDVSELIYVHSTYRETDEVVDVDGKQVLYHGYKAYASNGDEIEHFLGTKTNMANKFFTTAKTDDGKAWKDEGTGSKTVTEHTMTSAVVAKKSGPDGDAWANNDDAFVLVKFNGNVAGDHFDFLGSKSTKVVDLSDSKLYIESVAEINEAVKDGYYVEVAVIYNATDTAASGQSVGNVRVPVTIFVTKTSKDAADVAKIPVHTAGGGNSSSEGAYTFKTNTATTGKVKFAVVDVADLPADQTELDNIPANAWQDTVTADTDQIVLIKSADSTKKLDSVTAMNSETGAAITINQQVVANSGVYKYTVATANVTVTAVTFDAIEAVGVYVSKDATKINAILNKSTGTDEQEAQAIVDYINAHSKDGTYSLENLTATVAKNARGTVVGVALNGITVELKDITANVTGSMATVEVNEKPVIVANTATAGDVLGLEGITVTGGTGSTGTKVYITLTRSGDSVAANNGTWGLINDTAGHNVVVKNGDVIDTNGVNGYAKVDMSTKVTPNANGMTGTNIVAEITTGAIDIDGTTVGTAGSAQLVKIGTAFTVSAKGAADALAAANTKGGKLADNNTTTATAAVTPVTNVAAGTDITATTEMTANVTLTAIQNDVVLLLKSVDNV